MMKTYYLLGEKLGHSYSPRLHALLGDASYALKPLPPEQLDAFLTERAFDGANVTIPYKRAVIPYCAELGETARAIGSVNTLVKRADGTLLGDNTDAYGFAKLAERAGVSFDGRKVLVLGSGGTSLTACYVIRQAGGEAIVVSRHGETTYADLPQHRDAQVIVNTTPVGMSPAVDASPIDLTAFPSLKGVLDVIYNPWRTRLLQQARQLGLRCGGGLTMLVWQGIRARELFGGQAVSPERANAAEKALRRETTNLVLVGMPGCGKSTVGRLCAQRLGRELIDLDTLIVQRAGCTVPQIFAEQGEAAFREMEAQALAEACAHTPCVLATGGGAVLREDNRANLRMNGVVVRLVRPLEQLATGGRPLSTDLQGLRRMAETREESYRACADATVANEKTLAKCASAVLEAFDEALDH